MTAQSQTKDSDTQLWKAAALTKLSELLTALETYELCADGDQEIGGIVCDSREAEEGSLFVALEGAKENGLAFLQDAKKRGAVCAVCQTPPTEKLPYVLVPDTHAALAALAAKWYGEPAGKMQMIAVTGTNGKTTTTYLLKQLLETCLGAKVGLIGTNQNMIGARSFPTDRTTPNALRVQQLLWEMEHDGCTHVVMEVSSHALVQKRVEGIAFAVGIFTNLTQDHLDYHRTMEAYCDAKALLFAQCAQAIVNGDDPWSERLLRQIKCPVTKFGQNFSNDLVGWRPSYTNDSVRFTVCDDEEQIETSLHIPGTFSLYNALGTLAAARALGISLRAAAAALPACRGVRGRAEVVPTGKEYTILIDYSHTPDSLENILTTVCSFADERVIVVFGCGGDRDKTKRPQMGEIAARLADFVVVTSDNPRTEDPYEILHQILGGMRHWKTPFAVIENRREAIAFAMDHARRGDVIVLAGKGHETYQEIGTKTYPLDERQVVAEHLSKS